MALGRKRTTLRRSKPDTVTIAVDDEITDEVLAQQHSKRTLLRIRTSVQSKRYETARGRSVYWTADDEKSHEVKAFIRDTEPLKDPEKWEGLVRKGVTHLIIEDNENRVKVLPRELCDIQTLRSFTLMWSKVKVIPDYILHLQLTEFCIHKCPLKNVDGIHKMTSLVTLELVNDGLKKLPLELGELTNLANLDLTGNHISCLPISLSNLSKLRVLKVSGNDLSEIPNSISDLPLLDMLDFSHNHITRVSEQIGRLHKLVTLRISHNQIKELPSSFAELKSLRFLYMGHNQFTEVPNVLGSLSNLDTLNMVSNQVSTMNTPIEHLITLLLDKNELKELPQAIFQCYMLQKLSVQFNKLASVPPQIARLDNLRALYIGGNQFTQLPSDICMLNNLRHLVLRESKIKELPSQFDRLEHLSVIDVEETELDARLLYAAKTDGIKGLMEQVALQRELNGPKDEENVPQYPSDEGSSAFDSEDDPASEDGELHDSTPTKPDKDHASEEKVNMSKLRDHSVSSTRKNVVTQDFIPGTKLRPQTLYPLND